MFKAVLNLNYRVMTGSSIVVFFILKNPAGITSFINNRPMLYTLFIQVTLKPMLLLPEVDVKQIQTRIKVLTFHSEGN